MGKWVRWWGLGVFLVLVATIGFLWLLVVDGVVKAKIEEEGTSVVGAQVELDKADLTLFPTGLILTRLQITNPDEPMTNAVEIARISMGLDSLNLLLRKVIIDEMKVEGIQFGTNRATSGAIDDRTRGEPPSSETPESEQDDIFRLPPFEVPDVQKILEQEDLETLKLIEVIQEDIQREKELWEQRLKNLPGKAQFDKYQKRIKDLKSSTKGGIGGILGGVEEVQSIRKEIEQDFEEIKNARKEFDDKVALLKKRMAQAKVAPKNDIRRLKEKYSLSPQGLANLGQTLLGKQIGVRLKEATDWYEKLRPYLGGSEFGKETASGTEALPPARGAGVDVRFKEFQPLPEFLIRLAKVSLLLDVGEIAGKIENITPDQAVLGTPLTFTFSGDQLKNLQVMTLQGTLDHRIPTQGSDNIQFQAKGYRLQKVALSDQPDWPVALEDGLADVNVEAQLRGEALTATGTTGVSSLKVSAGRSGDSNPLTKALSSAVSDISTLSVKADVTGTIPKYDVRITSDLDRILQEAAGKMVDNLAASFGKDLETAISAKVSGPLKELKGAFGGLDAISGDLNKRLVQGNDLMKDFLGKEIPGKGFPGGFNLPF